MTRSEIKGHQVVCSALIEKDSKFLIIFCPKFKVWRVPGGRAEWGERIEETLLREMEEEVGVKFSNPKFIGFGQDQQFHVRVNQETSRLIMFFHIKTGAELTIDSDEAEEFKWVTLNELKAIENKEGALTDLFNRNPNLTL